MVEVADQLSQARVKFLNLVLLDANNEFDAAVQMGFGHDGDGSDTAADFAPVRGDYASNKFVQQLQSGNGNLAGRGSRVLAGRGGDFLLPFPSVFLLSPCVSFRLFGSPCPSRAQETQEVSFSVFFDRFFGQLGVKPGCGERVDLWTDVGW